MMIIISDDDNNFSNLRLLVCSLRPRKWARAQHQCPDTSRMSSNVEYANYQTLRPPTVAENPMIDKGYDRKT